MARRRSGINLSAPKVVTFIIAVALIVFGIVAYYTDVVTVEPDTAVLSLTIGAVLLALANLVRDL